MELFHALNRGVEKRTIFLDTQDYARFVHDMYEFNDTRPADANFGRRTAMMDVVRPSYDEGGPRTPIVDIHGWCLMKNHYHLLLSEKREGGLTMFLRKINGGYAKYFNERYARQGSLFQGRTKKVRIDSDRHFLYILHYVHLNPLDYLSGAEEWRLGHIESAEKALEHLAKYRWSSYLDYSGTKNFPSVLTKELFEGALGPVAKASASYLKDLTNNKNSELSSLGDLE